MDVSLSRALKRRIELQGELAKVERFIAAYHELFGTEREQDEPVSTRPMSLAAKARVLSRVRERVKTDRIVAAAERALKEAGKPMTRGELVEALEALGVELQSNDKPRYVGTILWRNSEKFKNVEGEGYWLNEASEGVEPEKPQSHHQPLDAQAVAANLASLDKL